MKMDADLIDIEGPRIDLLETLGCPHEDGGVVPCEMDVVAGLDIQRWNGLGEFDAIW